MKKFANFPSPHVHLQSLDTGSTLDEFVRRELELETGVLTCTDHGYLGACRDVYDLAKKNSLTPIIGIEGYHRDDNCAILTKHGYEKDKDGTFQNVYKYGHITMHALDQAAYDFLIKKVSDADLTAEQHGSERKPIFGWDDLEQLASKNMTMTTGCLIGIVGRHLKDGKIDLALDYYKKLQSITKPENLYVELFTHKCDKNWVKGVFLTLAGGKKIKYHFGKKLRTEEFESIAAADLAHAVMKGKKVGKLLAVKHYQTWENVEPLEIVNCEIVQDFIANECTPWCPNGDLQQSLNKFLYELAKMNGNKVIISDDAHYAFPENKVIQEAKLGGMGDSFRFYGNYHRHTSDEAYEHFKETMGLSEKEFESILNNNIEWASRFKSFELKYDISLPLSFYPKETLKHFKELVDKHGRMDWQNETMVDRLSSEIDLLHGNGTIDLLPYFFLGEEVCDLYERAGQLTGPGRGSAAGLLSAYLLGITHVNPLDYGLSRDRFLTIDRIKSGKLPDIDQDLPNRDLLLPWLKARFGDNVVQIGTNNYLRLKSSILDVARAHWGYVPQEIEALTKTIPSTPQGVEDIDFVFGYVGDDEKEVKGLIDHHKDLQEYTEKYPDQWQKVQKLMGIVRAKGRHASAFIVADKPIDSFIPLMTVNGVRTTQYTMGACEASGALKMDYLCLNTLVDVQETVKILQEQNKTITEDFYIINNKKVPKVRVISQKNRLYDIYELPEDQDVLRAVAEGETPTVFQFNTVSAQKWLKEFNYWKDEESGVKAIDSIEAMSAFTALDRPGPLDAKISDGQKTRNMLQEYAARARGEKPVDPIQFLMEALPETYGVMVYQEQLQEVYQKLTGCSGIDANKFREDVSKKRMVKVKDRYPYFMETAGAKIGEEQAQKIWDQIYTFGQYGFNKSHSVSYATLAYVCAYLKYHFPLQWWCGVLRNADKKEVSEKFWKHCKNFVQLPNVTTSEENFSIKGDYIVAPLSILQGVGETAHTELSANKPYKDIDDFCQKIVKHKIKNAKLDPKTEKMRMGRSALNRGVVSRLIVSGVLDPLFPEGLDLIAKLEKFEQSLGTAHNKNPEKIKEEYRGITPIQIFQHRKEILPLYTEFLPPYLFNANIEGVGKKIFNVGNSQENLYTFEPKDPDTIAFILKSIAKKKMFGKLAFVNAELLRFMNEDAIIDPDEPLHVAVAAYLQDLRPFSYLDKKTSVMRNAVEFTLDVNGEILRTVKWENKKTRELPIPPNLKKGSIVIAILSRWNERGFSVDAILNTIGPIGEEENE